MTNTTKEKVIYDYIVEYVDNNGYAPSIREICKALSISSTSTVQGYIKKLSDKGLLSRQEQKKRAIMPVSHINSGVTAPILGSIIAGEPLVAFENIEGYFTLPSAYNKSDDLFLLKVHGDSMVDAGIYENDLIIVKKQPVAVNGEIVVAMVDDAATVKTYCSSNGKVWLKPENKKYEPIHGNNITVLGKVVGLHRFL